MAKKKAAAASTVDPYEALRAHATERQLEILDALARADGSPTAAAKALGVVRTTVTSVLRAVQRKAARTDPRQHDYTKPLPDGFHLRGVSQHLGPNGEVLSQWVKSQADAEEIARRWAEAVAEIAAPFRGLSKFVVPPKGTGHLLCVLPVGDPHIGLYAWGEETGGSNFDLKIAEAQLVAAVDHLIEESPPSGECLILNLGDAIHADSQQERTNSGHQLDVDSRWTRVIQTAVRIFRRMIDRALERHATVRVDTRRGNHDPHSSMVLAMVLAAYYENNPRVIVNVDPAAFWYFQFGANLIATTHGDTTKHDRLPLIMAHDRPAEWGATRFRKWFVGHVHHSSVKEYPACEVETFNTMAPRDAWHAAAGYRSKQQLRLDVYHPEHGEVARYTFNPQMLEAA